MAVYLTVLYIAVTDILIMHMEHDLHIDYASEQMLRLEI